MSRYFYLINVFQLIHMLQISQKLIEISRPLITQYIPYLNLVENFFLYINSKDSYLNTSESEFPYERLLTNCDAAKWSTILSRIVQSIILTFLLHNRRQLQVHYLFEYNNNIKLTIRKKNLVHFGDKLILLRKPNNSINNRIHLNITTFSKTYL